MKYLTQNDLKFTIYEGEVCFISFTVFEDGDIDIDDFPAYTPVEVLKQIVEMAEEFVEGRKSLSNSNKDASEM